MGFLLTEAKLFLPWPHKDLSPNARVHWGKTAKAKKKAKKDAFWVVKEAGIGRIDADKVDVDITFYPPDNRRRDEDNILASLKAAMDGISEAIGIDDSKFKISFRMANAIQMHGQIKVELSW